VVGEDLVVDLPKSGRPPGPHYLVQRPAMRELLEVEERLLP
jgi:hypothetical protein